MNVQGDEQRAASPTSVMPPDVPDPRFAAPGRELPVEVPRGYRVLGLDEAAGGDGVFRQLVLARIIEPASKIDSFEPNQAGIVGSAACAS
jgi:hypothetical protein